MNWVLAIAVAIVWAFAIVVIWALVWAYANTKQNVRESGG